MTSAIDVIVNTIAMTSFTAVKTVLGDYVCAIYPVAMLIQTLPERTSNLIIVKPPVG